LPNRELHFILNFSEEFSILCNGRQNKEIAVSTATIVNFLKQGDIFYQFTPTQLELVANLCQEATFQKDDLIFRENSTSKELYVIVQ
jgi:hypothetical protein